MDSQREPASELICYALYVDESGSIRKYICLIFFVLAILLTTHVGTSKNP